jgi:sucrose-phosphate synthase
MHLLFLNPHGNFDEHDSHLTRHPDFGGQLIYVKELGMALADRGHRVDIVTRRIVDADWPEFAAGEASYSGYEGRLRILRFECGGPGFLPKEKLWPHLPELAERIARHYAGRWPDLATAHYADGGWTAALLQERSGIGFTFTGHSLGAQKIDKLGVELEGLEEVDRRLHFSRRIAAERAAMQRSCLVVTSTSQERFEQYAHPLYEGAVDVHDEGRFRVVPPGVDTRLFSAEAQSGERERHERLVASLRDPSRPQVVVSSRLDERKNILGVVRAYTGSRELQEAADLALSVSGIGDPYAEIDQMAPPSQLVLRPLLELIEEHGLRARVSFLDLPSREELAAAYRYFAARGSVFALTAFHEPFGLAPIEAAAAGLAVVATRNGGPSEIFADGSGVLVDPEDPDDIARGLLRALAEHERLAAAGRRRVLERYTWERTAQGYLEALEEGLRRRTQDTGPVPALDATDRIRRYLTVSHTIR